MIKKVLLTLSLLLYCNNLFAACTITGDTSDCSSGYYCFDDGMGYTCALCSALSTTYTLSNPSVKNTCYMSCTSPINLPHGTLTLTGPAYYPSGTCTYTPNCDTGYKPTCTSNCPSTTTCNAKTYTVNLDRNGAINGSTSVTATYDSAMPSATMPSRTGYTFDGYYDALTGGNQYYTASGASAHIWNTDGDGTLYAHWTAITSDVTLNAHGGTGGTASIIATYGSGMPSATMPTKTGSAFNGYYDAPSGGVQYYTSTGGSARNWDKISDTTLHAQWTANQYVITLNDSTNGGSGGSGTVTEVYGTEWRNSGGTVITSITIPKKSNSIFTGYYLSSSGGTPVVQSTGNLPSNTSFTSATTIYSQFTTCPSGTGTNGTIHMTVINNECSYYITCNDGYFSNNDINNPSTNSSLTCDSCSAGYYCASGAQNACPRGTTSPAGSDSADDCHMQGGEENGTRFCDSYGCFYLPDTATITSNLQ